MSPFKDAFYKFHYRNQMLVILFFFHFYEDMSLQASFKFQSWWHLRNRYQYLLKPCSFQQSIWYKTFNLRQWKENWDKFCRVVMKNGSWEGINGNILTLAGHGEGVNSQITNINKSFTSLKIHEKCIPSIRYFLQKRTLAAFSVNTNFLKYKEVPSFVSFAFATNRTISSKQSKFPETFCLYSGYPWLLLWLLVVLAFWAISKGTGVKSISMFCLHALGFSWHPKLFQTVTQEEAFNLPYRLK